MPELCLETNNRHHNFSYHECFAVHHLLPEGLGDKYF